MLKKLRVRFICITMAIVAVMLCIILGMVLKSTDSRLENANEQLLQSLLDNPFQFDWQKSQGARLPYFIVHIDYWGEITVSGSSYYDLSDETLLSDILAKAISSGESKGILSDYNLLYAISQQRLGEVIAFVDISNNQAIMKGLLRTCILIFSISMGIFLMISVLLARWAVKPVERAWKEQRQFVSDASHELKTPLTVILTNAELLQSQGEDPALRSQMTENILTMSKQMRGLVESLLQLARVDNGAVKKTFSEIDLSKLVTDAELPFEPMFFEKGLTLDCSIADNIRCKGSEQHLRQVVEILLDNAQKYSDSGTVKLKLERQSHSHALISVETPGIPLTHEQCTDIFKRFYRADEARAMNHSYGLGLPIAEAITSEHNGKIWAEGKSESNIFFVQLPTTD